MTIGHARIIKAAEIRAQNATLASAGAGAVTGVPAYARAETPGALHAAPGAPSNATHSVPTSALQSPNASARVDAPATTDGGITQLIGSTSSAAAESDADSITRIARAPGTDAPTRIARAPGAADAGAAIARTLESAHDLEAQAARVPLAVLNRADGFARRIPRVVVEAKDEAARIVAEAEARATAVAEEAARAAREVEVAKHAAQVLALREADERRAERDLERTIAVATLLAERLIGEALAVNPVRVAELAAAALEQTRGATSIRIDANPADVDPLAGALRDLVQITRIEADPTLGRGSLVVHTNLGKVDARLQPQLARLATALRGGAS